MIKEIKMKALKNKLTNQKFLIYGGGSAAYFFIKHFCNENNLTPYLILDKKFSKKGSFLGVPALNPKEYKPSEEEKEKSIVVIAVFNAIYINEIYNYLKNLGFKHILKIPKSVWEYVIKKETLTLTLNKINQKSSNKTEKKDEDNKSFLSICIKSVRETNCIIHVGMGKTGSTSIQISLNNYKDNKFYYARLTVEGNHSYPMYVLFSKNPCKHWYFRQFPIRELKKMKKEAFLLLMRSIIKGKEKNLIISGENILLLKKEELKNLKEFLSLYYDKILIYGYVREPLGYISSGFQEILKNKPISLNQLWKIYPFYKKTFQKFYKIFGEENVILKKFAPEKFPDGCVVKDFCNTLGISLKEDKIIRANVSLPKEIVNLLYIFRNHFHKIMIASYQVRFLIDLLSKKILKDIKFTPFKLSKKLIKPIIEKNRDDIRWIEGKLGEPLIEESLLEEEEEDYVIESEEDLLNIPPEVVERLRDYINYPDNNKHLQFQVAEMLLTILVDNFPDIKAQIEN